MDRFLLPEDKTITHRKAVNKKFSILLTSTIIESGLDLPKPIL